MSKKLLEGVKVRVALSVFIAIAWATVVVQASAEQPGTTLADFDGKTKLSTRWTAIGKITVSRIDVPPGVQHDGVQGRMAKIDSEPKATFLIRPNIVKPNYEQASAIRFRARAPEITNDEPLTIEFHVYSKTRRARFWRKIEIDDPSWQTIELPLKYFRQSRGAVLNWSEVNRFGFYFRDEGALSIDNIELVSSNQQRPAYLSSQEIAVLAFGDTAKVFRNDRFEIITDEPRMQGEALLAALDKMHDMVYSDFPKITKPRRPVVMLVFAKENAYRNFWKALGKQFNSVVPVVNSDGYAIFGIGGSFYSEKHGAVRPVYIQEACHAMLAQSLGIANESEWLHEGLANHYQLKWSEQDVRPIVNEMRKQDQLVPLPQLLNGRAIGIKNYAQAVAFIQWLISDKTRKQQLQAAMTDFKQRTSTDLNPVAKKHFGRSVAEVEKEWLVWLAK